MDLFKKFFQSERTAGFILIACAIVSLIVANSSVGETFVDFFHSYIDVSFSFIDLKYTVEHWVNDGLMAVFFLLVGLEIERELYVGELSNFKTALLPIIAAAGGMAFPALIHFLFNNGTVFQIGFGIPMATDIAFALGVLSLLGNKVPVSLKIFLTALAIIDDLGAITVIALFYTKSFSGTYFFSAILIFAILFVAGKRRVYNLPFYIIGGVIMWYCMLKSGVHSTIAGVLLAFAIPFHKDDNRNPSYALQKALHYPVAFFVLPIFAITNTAILFPQNILSNLTKSNSVGIMLGLLLGKFIGIFLISFLAVKAKVAELSADLTWRHILGISFLGGIGFTMSIFITNLAFDSAEIVAVSKISILIASLAAAIIGYLVLVGKPKE